MQQFFFFSKICLTFFWIGNHLIPIFIERQVVMAILFKSWTHKVIIHTNLDNCAKFSSVLFWLPTFTEPNSAHLCGIVCNCLSQCVCVTFCGLWSVCMLNLFYVRLCVCMHVHGLRQLLSWSNLHNRSVWTKMICELKRLIGFSFADFCFGIQVLKTTKPK